MKIVLITGGSGGIGASAARQCAADGMGVIVTYNIHPDSAEDVVKEIEREGGQAAALKLDVARTGSFGAFRDELKNILRHFWGRENLDVLVNNAGFGLFNPIESVTENQFDELFRVHLKGPFFLTQMLLPLISDGGHIINITSATTRVATAGVAPYAAFKGGLEVLTRYMAKEFGARGIRANSLSPGAVRTSLGGGLIDEFEQILASQTSLGRVGEPDDVGRVIAGLASERNGWINAQSIEVAGGYQI